MTITSTEIGFYKSKVVSSDSTNGGRLSSTKMISGVANNLWPNVLKAERDSGSILFRKMFIKVDNDADETLLATEIWNDHPTPGDDYIVMFAGTQRDTQADITGSERLYGAASLNTDVSSGSTIIVDVEHVNLLGIFQDGDKIRITNKEVATDASGYEEYLTISGTPTNVDTVVTITVAESIQNAYVTSTAKVESLYEFGDLACSVDNWVETSASGTYDETTYPLITDNIATVEETFTLTFSDANSFTIVGDTLGSVGSGTIAADFSPTNADFSRPFFTLSSGGWGGTWASGDTIVFQTHPAAVPVWLKRTVPAGSASLSGNKNTTVTSGESA